MDEETRVSRLHLVNYALVALLVTNVVLPEWERDRDRMVRERGHAGAEWDLARRQRRVWRDGTRHDTAGDLI